MPDGISGIFFENQILTAKGLGAFANATMSDGILSGCKVSVSGLNVTMNEGYISICGRVVKIPQQSFTLSADTGHGTYHAIVASVNTNAISDEDTFTQVTISTVTGNASMYSPLNDLHSGYDPTNNFTYDINMSGSTASTWLVILRVQSSQASVSQYNYANAMSMVRLWTNSDLTSSFSAQTLSLPTINKYDALLVVYRKTNGSDAYQRQSMICPYSRSAASGTTYVFDLIHSTLNDSSPYTNVLRQRRMTISPADNTVTFSTGWVTGGSAEGNAGTLIPVEIFGLRAGNIKY